MFDEKYFNDIWGTVHRHDYCESVSEALIQKYGKVRFLDIGTGCGELVRLLNNKGASAKGLEISKYAVDNSHGNVILGTVTDIPFKDNSFDVIYSQGLWCHIKEEEIEKGWSECLRVGIKQEHFIDYEEAPLDIPFFYTRKSEEWWKDKLKLKLNLGCGGWHLPGFVNYDLTCPEAIKHDLRTPLPYFDSTIDEIYASHIVEHFSREEWEKVKVDWLRILKPGGLLTVACPNIAKCLQKLLNEPDNDYWIKTIYGSQEDELNIHKHGFTKESLIKELKEFTNFKIIEDEAENLEIICTKI